jgi:hypothetical protein
MKPRWVLWLYPRAWRARYRAELEALIEDSGSRGGDTFDLFREAIRMRLLETWSFAQLAVVLGLAGALSAAVVAVKTPPKFLSESEMQLSSPAASVDELSDRFIQMENEMLSRTSLAEIIKDPRLDLYSKDRRSQPLEDVIERMRGKDIRIEMVRLPKSGVGAKISFLYADKFKAQQTVQALISHLADSNAIRQRLARGTIAGMNLEVLAPPSLPHLPAWPNRYLIVSTGLGAGLLLAAITKLVMRLRRTTSVN